MKYKAYICSTDAKYHIPDDYDGIRIFFSKKALLENSKCINSEDKYGCEVCEIEIEVPDQDKND